MRLALVAAFALISLTIFAGLASADVPVGGKGGCIGYGYDKITWGSWCAGVLVYDGKVACAGISDYDDNGVGDCLGVA